MKGRMGKVFTASVLACTLAFSPLTAFAESAENSDTQSLMAKVAELEEEVAALEDLIGIKADSDAAQSGTEADRYGNDQTESETQAASAKKQETDVDQFIEAAVKSCTARIKAGSAYSEQQIASMNREELTAYYGSCVKAEEEFYNRYAKAKFSNKNLSYLCYKYRLSIERQKAAVMNYQAGGEIDTFNEEWDLGYYDRAMALVELHDIYGAAFDETLVDQMRRDLSYDKLIKKGLEGNAGVDSETILYVQNLLNKAGYDCGAADGECGKATVRAIRHFQEMYGTVVDGIIDSELIAQLGG